MLGVDADIIYAYYVLSSSPFDLSREKTFILGDRMDFADILQSMKTGKNVETLTFRVVLDSLRTVCQVFDIFFPSSRQNNFEKFTFWR